MLKPSESWLNLPSSYPLDQPARGVPDPMVKAFRIEAKGEDGEWRTIHRGRRAEHAGKGSPGTWEVSFSPVEAAAWAPL